MAVGDADSDDADDTPRVVASAAVAPVVEVVRVFALIEVVESWLPGAKLRGVTRRGVGLARSEGEVRPEGETTLAAVSPGDLPSIWAFTSLVDGAVFADACPLAVA